MYKGVLKIYFSDKNVLRSIFESLDPDNRILPDNIDIYSVIEGNCLIINVECKERIGSLLNTLDELIGIISVSVKCIELLQQTYK